MDDFDRAFALMDRIDERVAEGIDPTPHGELVVSTRLFHVHDQNFLRVRDPGDATAAELAAEAEAAHGRYPAVRHRRVNLRGVEVSDWLEPGFVALGWEPQRFRTPPLECSPARRGAADRGTCSRDPPR